MKKVIVLATCAFSLLAAQETEKAHEFEYIGSEGCKICHSGSKKGGQYKVWADGVHAKAFDSLKTEEAAKIAAERGLELPAYEAPECIVCHVTGYGKGGYEVKDEEFWNPPEADKEAKKAVKRMKGLQAVGCEVCHGPGSEYKSMKVMKAIFGGTVEGKSVGLLVPNEATCKQCHNENSPAYKPFEFENRGKEIAHPYPPDMKQ
ncbi:MAG: cytochrome c family protein [Candidatus Neomarinimicrobiota bacterium]